MSCPRWCFSTPIARRLPGALTPGSGELESFSAALEGDLEHPHYTRPAQFRGWTVPDVLLSGNHSQIESLEEGAEEAANAPPTTGGA